MEDIADIIGRHLDPLTASRKADRDKLAVVFRDIATGNGATVEQRHEDATRGYCGQGIMLRIECNGVGAMLSINDLHGGDFALIHWHNTKFPSRNFSPAFNRAVGDHGQFRPHHKATSHPRTWSALAIALNAGLELVFRGEAFEPAKAEASAT